MHERERTYLLPPRRELFVLALITILAAGLRFWQLAQIPPGFHYDEALEGLEAWRVLTRVGYHPAFFPGDFGLSAMFIYLTSFAFRVFGATPLAMRGLAAFLGTATIPVIYGLGRELVKTDDRLPVSTPLLAAASLAIMRWHLQFSRIGIEPVLVPLFLCLILWAFWAALRSNRMGAWLGLGVAVGLSIYTYPAAWLLLPMVILFALYVRIVDSPRLAGRGRGAVIACLVALVLATPLIWDFARMPAQLFARSGQVSAIQGGQAPGKTLAAIWTNLLRTLGLFSFTGDIDPRNNLPGAPALDLIIAVPFYLGVAVALWRWRRPGAGTPLLAGTVMLAATIMSQYAPHFRRALGATPAVALLTGLGLAVLAGGAGRLREPARAAALAGKNRARWRPSWPAGFRRLARPGRIALVVTILIASAALTARTYFLVWSTRADLYHAWDEGLWQIGQYVRGLPGSGPIYITPRPASDATLAFAWKEGPAVRHFDGRHAFVAPAYRARTGEPATYVIIDNEDFRATGLLTSLYPDAQLVHEFLDRNGDVYARVFQVPTGTQPARGPANPVQIRWQGIDLTGYDLNAAVYRPGDTIYLQLWWRSTAPVTTDWTVFTHLLGPTRPAGTMTNVAQTDPEPGAEDVLWAGHDDRPGDGSAPTTTWQPGDLVLDEYQIPLPADIPAGQYSIEVGLYDLAHGGMRAQTVDGTGADHVILGQVTVDTPTTR